MLSAGETIEVRKRSSRRFPGTDKLRVVKLAALVWFKNMKRIRKDFVTALRVLSLGIWIPHVPLI